MKLKLNFALAILFAFSILQTGFGQCQTSSIEYLRANQVKAAITNGGDFFWNRNDGQFVVPYVPGQSPEQSVIFANGLWLGGFDAGGNLKVACQTYGNANGRSDFWPGPIDESTSQVFTDGCEKFDRIWKVNRGAILQVKEDFADNGTIDMPLPATILSWPGRGNPHFQNAMGFELPDQELAPFFDRNNNDIYEPMNGEYPILEGFPNAVPDEMTWCVFNDIQSDHEETNGQPLGAEVHFMTYAFNCSENEMLNYTVFTRHKIFNKSAGDISGFRMGFWSDMDLGCFADDYLGCDTILNTQYFYNADNDDDDALCSASGVNGYGENPPVQATTFLNQNMSSFMYYNNPVFGNPAPDIGSTDPAVSGGFYNFMSSRWGDGTPLTFGGDGYDTTSSNTVNFAFFDNPNDPDGWSMNTEQLPRYDRRTVMTAGPFDLPKNENIILDAAFSYHREAGANHLENVDFALNNIPGLQNFYNLGLMENCSQFTACTDDCIWPGDIDRNEIARNDDLLYLGVAMGKDPAGANRNPASILWAAQPSENWLLELPNGANYKNADCNGDGKVDDLDYYILDLNYDKRTPTYMADETVAPFAEGGLYIDLSKEVVTPTDNFVKRLVKGDIYLASENEPLPFLYGISFSIKYDPDIWEPGLGGLVLPDSTFLGNADGVLSIGKIIPEEGRIEVAFSRKDGQAVSNAWGKLGQFRLILREDAPIMGSNGTEDISFPFFDAQGVGNQENFFLLGAKSDTVTITNMPTTVAEKYSDNILLQIMPNPNSGAFNLFFEKNNLPMEIYVFDFQGKYIWGGEVPVNSQRFSVDLSETIPAGLYFIKLMRGDGYFTTRKVIVK
ncbi:MAG TPA: T9SS type A sorting domain-containing protein [Bacteroidetes bacterium]|nr:T9SS type A sorting domain-containing protein [Bacteroidota bacterium]